MILIICKELAAILQQLNSIIATMSQHTCPRQDCFYSAGGSCTSLTALSALSCRQFRDKAKPFNHMQSRRLDLAQLRRKIQANTSTQPRLSPREQARQMAKLVSVAT